MATAVLVLFGTTITVPVTPADAATTTRATTLARGVTYWRQTFRPAGGGSSRAVLLHIDLRVARLSIAPASDGETVGGPLRRLSYLANTTHAIAGINGDFFHESGAPYGGLMRGGRLLESPRPFRIANFFIRGNGTAGIGAVPFTAQVTRPAVRGRTSTSHRIMSVNSIADATDNGWLTYVTHDLVSISLGSRCTAALGSTTKGVSRVSGVETGARHLARRPAGSWALIACDSPAADWMKSKLRANDRVVISTSFPNGRPRALLGGGAILVRHGAAYNDKTRLRVTGRNPETFACVSRDGRSVLLGVVDGRSNVSSGVTFHELTVYLLARHCYDGMVFDGGGSTELVARLPRHTTVSVLNVPSDGEQRPIPDGLFVY
ncbi:MAG TPA: phosphodiester glycosidase family protein [Jatrophihabitans sp.]|nr:phosphodiester glycosidase family protein [Jatrophihabitans sp.]